MSSDLLSIGRSGTTVARIALDVTAQNIANAANADYVRRTATIAEVASTGSMMRPGDVSLSGARLAGIARNVDPFQQSEARRTGSDLARADAELSGLRSVETAVEQSGVFPAIVSFQSSLDRLSANPTDLSLRGAVVEQARTMASSFAIATQELDAVQDGLTIGANATVDQVNLIARDLAAVNLGLARLGDGTSDKAPLLDRRDALLQSLAQAVDIRSTFAANGTVTVQVGGSAGPTLVAPGATQTLAMTSAADGRISFTLGGVAVTPSAGSLAGTAQALAQLATTRSGLDTVAGSLIATANNAQANGAALDGSAGQPLFAGTGARDIALALANGSGLATAPAGSPAGSRDASNLAALRSALTTSDPAGAFSGQLFDLSSLIAGRGTTRAALATIATTAHDALLATAGVDIDQETVNLVRFQQAFQASGKVLQVASTLFDTLLAIR